MKKRIKKVAKILAYIVTSLLLVLLIFIGIKMIQWNMSSKENLSKLGPKANSLTTNGMSVRDLNKNGTLDIYEDNRASLEDRVENLLGQMTIEEKAGSMFITLVGVGDDGDLMERPSPTNIFSFLMPSNSEMIVNHKMSHFNIMDSHAPEAMVKWQNKVQKLAERTRLGIPITIASDPRHGFPETFGVNLFTPYFSRWPSALGLGATRDSSLVASFAEIVRQEYKTIGIRLALGPMADVATEPRWTRFDGTFGEDAKLNATLTASYIKGLQGDSLTSASVATMVKHFPGSGPLDGGKDNHFPPGIQSYPGGQFLTHLKPFEAAFNVGVSSVMTYYSVPKGITSEDVAAGYNKGIITGLLREKYNFDGIVCTDWGIITDAYIFGMKFKPATAHGVEHLSVKERIKKIIDAGADMIGGETLSSELAELIHSGEISESRINESIRRILRQKFQLGLFDNPYLDEESLEALNKKEFSDKGIEAQQKSLVLLKNEGKVLPLSPKSKVHLYGFDEDFVETTQAVSIEEADFIIVKLNTPSGRFESEYLMEELLGGGPLDFTQEELNELLPMFGQKPTILVMNFKRPAVIPELAKAAQVIIADFNVENDIIMDLIYGNFSPSGKLPFNLPESMKAVNDQLEDVPFDTPNPLYKFGDGLSY